MLDELVEKIRPMVSSDLDVAVRKSRRKAQELQEEFSYFTEDERAMLTLYTIEMYPKECSLYFVMNQALRGREREKVVPWRDHEKAPQSSGENCTERSQNPQQQTRTLAGCFCANGESWVIG